MLRDATHNLVTQVADFFWICASLWLVVTAYPAAAPWATMHTAVAAFAAVLFCFVGSARRLYQVPWLRQPVKAEVKAVLVCWAWVVAPLIMLGFATKVLSNFSRIGTFAWIVLAPALIVIYRSIARISAPAARTTRRRAAIAGVSAFSERMASEIHNTPSAGLHVVGIFDDRACPRYEPGAATLRNDGSFAQLVAAARQGAVDVVYIALPLRAELRMKALIRDLQDTTASVYVAFDFASLAGEGHHRMSHVDGLPVVPLLAGAKLSSRKRARSSARAARGDMPRSRAS
jgi:putative colanic acid biosynthesis UDP-glucose lipid carrier transferase